MKKALGVVAIVGLLSAFVVWLFVTFAAQPGDVDPESRFQVRYTVDLSGSAATYDQAAHALLVPCVAQVETALVSGPTPLGGHVYRAVLSPRLDQADRTEFRGCLHDLRVESMRAEDIELLGEDPR